MYKATLSAISLCLLGITFAQADLRAYKDISFKDSLLDVCEKVERDEDLQLSIYDTCDEVMEYDVGGVYFVAEIAGIEFTGFTSFYEDQLFRVSFIEPEGVSAKFINSSVADKLANLNQLFTKRFNKPPSPSQEDDSSVWTDGDKAYNVGSFETDFLYRVAVTITYTPLADAAKAEIEEDEQQNIEESSDDF